MENKIKEKMTEFGDLLAEILDDLDLTLDLQDAKFIRSQAKNFLENIDFALYRAQGPKRISYIVKD